MDVDGSGAHNPGFSRTRGRFAVRHEEGNETVELVSQAGQHDEADQGLIVCGLLAPA